MFLNVLVGSIFAAVLIAALLAGAYTIRRRQRALNAKREAAQLQRRADHLFKIALATQVHTQHDSIARILTEEALRVLEYANQLDRDAKPIINSMRECRELIANLSLEPKQAASETRDRVLEFPETELIEAQLHLTEAMRLLVGLEKRGKINYDAFTEMTIALKQAQRAIDLRLQLHQASVAINGERATPKRDEARTGEYFAVTERDRVQSTR